MPWRTAVSRIAQSREGLHPGPFLDKVDVLEGVNLRQSQFGFAQLFPMLPNNFIA
jgi:hypothetical protein